MVCTVTTDHEYQLKHGFFNGQVWAISWERVSLLQESHLNWPNNQVTEKTVAHIIDPRENHTIHSCHWFSTTVRTHSLIMCQGRYPKGLQTVTCPLIMQHVLANACTHQLFCIEVHSVRCCTHSQHRIEVHFVRCCTHSQHRIELHFVRCCTHSQHRIEVHFVRCCTHSQQRIEVHFVRCCTHSQHRIEVHFERCCTHSQQETYTANSRSLPLLPQITHPLQRLLKKTHARWWSCVRECVDVWTCGGWA